MIFEIYNPEPPFDQFIDNMVYFKGYDPGHAFEKIVPDGSINIVMELDNIERYVLDNDTFEKKRKFTGTWLSGVIRDYITISVIPDSEMFVVRFKPGGTFPFLNLPINEITNSIEDAENYFGKSITELRNTLLQDSSPHEKFTAGIDWLNSQYDESKKPEDFIFTAVNKIKDDPTFENNKLNELIDESGYSKKQFIHLFKKYVGLTPKVFQRIVRFNEILTKIQNKEKVSWASISNDCGYFDQAHFIKEFKHFCGINPQEHIEQQKNNERTNFFPQQR